jgi:amino-acid N-acetyltransferase
MTGLRRTRPAEYESMRSALAAERLPTEDLCAGSNRLYAFEEAGEVLGYAALERHGGAALLRSVVVPRERRRAGIGRRLVKAMLAEAAARGHREVHLLTTTAAEFFERLGFERIPREAAPAELSSSAEFARLCPATAACMRIRVAD